jgi:hypothetical protein
VPPINEKDLFTATNSKGIVAIIILIVLGVLALGALVWLLIKLVFAAWFVTALWFDWWWIPTGIGIIVTVVPYLIWLARNMGSLVRAIGRVRALRKSTVIGGSIGAALSLMSLAGNLTVTPEERSKSMWVSFWISIPIFVLVFAFIGRTVQFIWDEMARALGPRKKPAYEPLKTPVKALCGNCNAITNSNTKFCRECGTALPETDLNQPRVQYHRINIQHPPALGVARIVILVCSVLFLSVMALIGTETDAVWSGTGYTRGSGDWIPIWSDEFLAGS